MDPITALHTAVRRLCTERYTRWCDAYAELNARGENRRDLPDGSWVYTEAACRIFPRYQLLDAALMQVERLVPADFASVDACRALLAEAADAAKKDIPNILRDAISAAAVEEEIAAFRTAVLAMDPHAHVEPLPFRRVLSEAEAKSKYDAVAARFGTWYGGFPDRTIELEQLTLGSESVGRERLEALRAIVPLEPRLIELRETGPSFEVEPAAARFFYGGAEVNIVPPSLSWMFYASHEDTVSFVGAELVARVKYAWPDWQKLH